MSTARFARFGIVFLCFFSISSVVAGENPPFAIIWNQLWSRQFCFEVEPSAIDQVSLECGAKLQKPTASLRMFSWQVFERAVFSRAAEIQLKKDSCLIDQLCVLSHADDSKKDKDGKVDCNGHKVKVNRAERKDRYIAMLALAWLGKKKAELILRACRTYFLPGSLVASGLQKMKIPAVYEKWRGVCSEKSNVDALKEVDTIYSMLLPVASSSRLFDVIEKNRHYLTNVETGFPLSDVDILSHDFTDKEGKPKMGFFGIHNGMDSVFRPQVTHELERMIAERQDLFKKTGMFAKAKHSVMSPIEADVKDYLFREGTVDQVLEESGQISEDENGDRTETAGASCIHSRYQESMGGAIVDFTVNMLLGGGLAKGFLNKAAATAAEKGLAVIGQSEIASIGSKVGAGFATALDLKRQVVRSCLSLGYRSQNLDAIGDQVKRLRVADMDNEPSNYIFAFDDEETPNCSSESEKKRLANERHRVNCIKDAFFSIAPIQIALPLILTSF